MIEQPNPITNSWPQVWSQVIDDMTERNKLGIKRYGTPLQPFNGRDSLIDVYEELLDASVYIKQAIIERNTVRANDILQLNEAPWMLIAVKVIKDGVVAANLETNNLHFVPMEDIKKIGHFDGEPPTMCLQKLLSLQLA